MADFVIKEGDTAPALHVTFVHPDDSPVNLTGATVTVNIRPHGGGDLLVDSAAVVVGDPLDGTVEYEWVAGDTDEPGDYDAEWLVVWAAGSEQTFPTDGYTTIEVAADLVSAAVLIPALPDSCWPVDEGCCADLAGYSLTIQDRAKALAGQTLRMLTGYRVGGCATAVRPCTRTAMWRTNWYASGSGFYPLNTGLGYWVNACGCQDSCGHLGSAEVVLPGPIGRVDEVLVDGLVVDPISYRVDNGNHLVRIDGQTWPLTQNMMLETTEIGTFQVTYLQAVPVDALGAYAAGVLACEYAKACSGGKCRLPAGVTTVVRQGIAFEIAAGAFGNGLTGIREVDAYIQRWNPNHLIAPTTVWSPDLATSVRTTTIPSGA